MLKPKPLNHQSAHGSVVSTKQSHSRGFNKTLTQACHGFESWFGHLRLTHLEAWRPATARVAHTTSNDVLIAHAWNQSSCSRRGSSDPRTKHHDHDHKIRSCYCFVETIEPSVDSWLSDFNRAISQCSRYLTRRLGAHCRDCSRRYHSLHDRH